MRVYYSINYGVIFMVYGLTSAGALLVLTFEISPNSPYLTYCLGLIQGVGTLCALFMGRMHTSQLKAMKYLSRVSEEAH
jgi:hypothetical protein